jgi:hypothetical protein
MGELGFLAVLLMDFSRGLSFDHYRINTEAQGHRGTELAGALGAGGVGCVGGGWCGGGVESGAIAAAG